MAPDYSPDSSRSLTGWLQITRRIAPDHSQDCQFPSIIALTGTAWPWFMRQHSGVLMLWSQSLILDELWNSFSGCLFFSHGHSDCWLTHEYLTRNDPLRSSCFDTFSAVLNTESESSHITLELAYHAGTGITHSVTVPHLCQNTCFQCPYHTTISVVWQGVAM